MEWVYIEDIAAHDGQDVEIRGWVYNKRSSGKVRFLLVRDGTGDHPGHGLQRREGAPLFSSSSTA